MISYRKIFKFILPIILAYFLFCGDKFNPESIKGKKVLITGASSGIGEQVAYKYAKLGAKLVIAARRNELLQKVEQKCKELGAELVISVPVDLAKSEDRYKLVLETLKIFNGLDILILNHGWLQHKRWGNTADDFTMLLDMMNVNFFSFVDISMRLIDALSESNGYIGVVSSIAGKVGMPRIPNYCASKHALQGFFASLRQDLRVKSPGVSVSIAVFGLIASEKAKQVIKADNPSINFSNNAGSCEDAADALVRGVANRQYEVYFPTMAKVYKYGLRLFPYFLEDLPRNAVQNQKNKQTD